MKCDNQPTWAKYNAETGIVTTAVPMLKQDVKMSCVFNQMDNGKFAAKHEIITTFKAVAKSACVLTEIPTIVEVDAGKKNEVNVAMTMATSTAAAMPVKDTVTQCPGDKFALACVPQPAWATFDMARGIATANAPATAAGETTQCTLIQTTRTGDVVKRVFTMKVMVPKS